MNTRNPELRIGDSARARFFRLKDELLDFPTDKIISLIRQDSKNEWIVNELYTPLVKVRNHLEEDADDEDALKEGESLMRRLAEEAVKLGLKEKV